MSHQQLLFIAMSLLLAAMMADSLMKPRTSVFAQSPAPSFTISSTGDGVAIIDQATGAVTVCSSLVTVSPTRAVPSDKCALLGRIAPSSASGSLSAANPQNSLFVINNQTGHIIQCATIDFTAGGVGSPNGDSCVDQGLAFR